MNENLGAGVFGDRVLISADYSGKNQVITGDIDLDGDIDLVTSSYDDSKVVWFENTGDGTFEAPSILASDIEFVNDLELGDFDGDGDLDVHALGIFPAKIGWFENATINPFHV